MKVKSYYSIKNVRKNIVILEYVTPNYEKAKDMLARQFRAETNAAIVVGYKKPVDTLDADYFYYNSPEKEIVGEWKIESVIAI